MKIPPFHSWLRGVGLEDAWHDNNECGIGKTIALADRVAGKGGISTRCKFCAMLDQPGPVLKRPVVSRDSTSLGQSRVLSREDLLKLLAWKNTG